MPPAPFTLVDTYDTGATHELARRASLAPTDAQKITLIVAASYVVAIAILPYLKELIYPFKLLTVGMHEMCHAIAGILTCARVQGIELDPDEGGCTTMRGGIPAITLPAGYLGSSLIGAALITCGFDTDASKVACLVLAAFFFLTLYWARRSWIAYATIALMVALIIVRACVLDPHVSLIRNALGICMIDAQITWLVADSVALRFLVLFIGVMSCLYCIWDIIDDTLARKVNSSDASEYADMIGCCSSRFWGAFWLLQSICFFVAGILVGLVAFRETWAEQADDARHFLGGTP
ncbi:hypothetical protein Q5752_005521 [Cryptotrichosporon argae]